MNSTRRIRRFSLALSIWGFRPRAGVLTALRAGFPLTLELSDTKLPKRSWAKISQVRTLSTKRIGKKIASTPPEELVSIIDGLNEIIGG